MKIGTVSSPYSGNNVNITMGRIEGVDVNSAFVVDASAASSTVASGTAAIWDLSTVNEQVKTPVVADFCTTTATDVIITKNRKALCVVLYGYDEEHNTHISRIAGVPVTVIKANDVEVEIPVVINASASAPKLCIDLYPTSANYGKFVYDDPLNDATHDTIEVSDVKLTGINSTKGIIRVLFL